MPLVQQGAGAASPLDGMDWGDGIVVADCDSGTAGTAAAVGGGADQTDQRLFRSLDQAVIEWGES